MMAVEAATGLEAITGIGPAFAKKLEAEGVGLRELADANDDDIDRWDAKLGLRGKPREQEWQRQAIEILTKQAEGEERGPMPIPPAPALPQMQAQSNDAAALAKALGEIERLKDQLAGSTPASGLRDAEPEASFGRRPRRLNRNRKFSEVYGNDDNHPGSAYMQMVDGRALYFDHHGVEVGEGLLGEPEPVRKVTDPEEVHFLNWMDSKVEYPLPLVIKAIRSRFGGNAGNITTEKQARLFLHKQFRMK